ncbi:hypothetical protein [Nonomuraea candida]|uniref:hypothetical protein n=1 Tax=Nonomuraea candida TaxID=359159 RepID=UPI000AAC8D5A|nr:hypothetical protein [Nonomuraea candida]
MTAGTAESDAQGGTVSTQGGEISIQGGDRGPSAASMGWDAGNWSDPAEGAGAAIAECGTFDAGSGVSEKFDLGVSGVI